MNQLLALVPEPALRIAAAAVRRVQRLRGAGTGLALVYHRVAPQTGDPARELLPAIATADFAAQIEHLCRHYRPVTAGELARAAAGRRRGRPLPVAVTFDDDLASHTGIVAQILRRNGAPATFFLTGSTLAGPRPFWWQRLQQLADRQGAEPISLRGVSPRARGLHEAARAVERMTADARDAVARVVEGELDGIPIDEPGLPQACLARLTQDGFEIGFHTRDHHPLPTLDDERLSAALRDGRAALEAAAAQQIVSFAYPHGACDARTAAAARRAGFQCAFSTSGEPLRRGSDPWRIGRFEPRSPSLGAFSLKLALAPSRSQRWGR